jgi:hypothetical protein
LKLLYQDVICNRSIQAILAHFLKGFSLKSVKFPQPLYICVFTKMAVQVGGVGVGVGVGVGGERSAGVAAAGCEQ